MSSSCRPERKNPVYIRRLRNTMFFNLLKSDTTKTNKNNKAMEDVIGDEASHSGASSPYIKSPWWGNQHLPLTPQPPQPPPPTVAAVNTTGLVGSLVREEGHVYSLAASGDLLYTGSESKNIRVWRRQYEFSGFKSASGFVKAIVVTAGDRRVFTGHQDGKIRVWRVSVTNPAVHKRVGSLPKLKDCVKSSFNPSNYVDVHRHRSVLWLKHFDAVSCLSFSEDEEVLYSGSWDRTIKVWSTSKLKCLESIDAHQDAVNSVVTGFGGLVFSGSADGTVKVWRRKFITGKATEHSFVDTLLKQESAVTSLAVMNSAASVLYCGSSDGVVNFWEMEKNSSHGGVLRGHSLAVLCLKTAGPLVTSGSTDKTICVWRRGSDGVHSCLSVLSGHLGPVKCLAVDRDHEAAEDGKWLVYSGSLDRSVKIWKVSVSDGRCRNIFRH